MKNILIYIFILIIGFFPFISLPQKKITPQIYVSQSFHSKVFTETAIGLGVNKPLRTGDVSLLFHYQYGGN